MNFSLLSSMDFLLHQISVGPDETKVIRETQVGHLRAITAKRAHCLWRKANAASLVRKVKKSIVVLSAIPCLCCRLLHNINNVNYSAWVLVKGNSS